MRGVSFAYRYVSGFSTCTGPGIGATWRLELVELAADAEPLSTTMPPRADAPGHAGPSEAEAIAADARPSTTTLWQSADHPATPYSFDAATGGHPSNYSPLIRVAVGVGGADGIGPLRGVAQRLQIVFVNGCRNIHLQGEDTARRCDLNIAVHFDAPPESASETTPRAAPGALLPSTTPPPDEGIAFLIEAFPGVSVQMARAALAACDGRLEAAAEALLAALGQL